MADAADMLERAAKAAREKRNSLMPRHRDSQSWDELPEDVKDRWRAALAAARDELGLTELWQPIP